MDIDLDRLVDVIPGLVWATTPDRAMNFLNRRWREFCGPTTEAEAEADWKSSIHPEDRELVEACWGATLASGAVGEVEARLRRHDGTYRRFRIRTRPYRDAVGTLVCWCGINTEIEARERTGRATAPSSRKGELPGTNSGQLTPQSLSHVGIFTVDLLKDEHVWSEEMYRIWEVEPGEEITQPEILRRIHPDDQLRCVAEYARVLEGAETDFALRLITPSGKLKYVRSTSRVLTYANGGPVVVGAYQDETDRVVAEQALRASEAELRRANAELINAQGHITAAQRLSQTGSFIWDVAADQHHWSDELYRIAEIDPGVTINMERVRNCIHPEDWPALEAAIEQAMAGSGFDYSGRIITPTVGVKHFHIVGQRIEQFTDRLVFVGALRDVTESKAAQAALNKARADLAHASRVMALSALTASIAHEVNQPLAGIVANAATCSRMLAADPPNIVGAQATAQRMIRDGDRAAEVIRRLRALFSNKPPQFEAVKLDDAAAEVLALASTELQAAGVTVRTEFERGLPPVRGDRVQLQQVVLNLVLNAAEAMNAVEGRPRELTLASAREGEENVRLWVRDVGVGVAPDSVENLFEAFHTTKEKGMGVGLAVSRSIIESHQGRLWAEPNEGPGATFTFTLPAQSDAVLRPRT